MKTAFLFLILAILWVLFIANRRLKRTVEQNAGAFNTGRRGEAWSTGACSCGAPRTRWKALAMNRPDNTVLLYCPECLGLWEEYMSMYGNKWRPVDEAYARENYQYNVEFGRNRLGT